MKPTVITTGPGVIIATATASTNCRSVNHWLCVTTPPHRKGTIAKPLPNTNAPASPKNTAILVSTGQSTVVATAHAVEKWSPNPPSPSNAGVLPFGSHRLGGALTIQTSTPATRKTHTLSDSVNTVEAPATI